jgi:tRNA dimethylallyltransferase
MKKKNLIAIIGATAIGKTDLSIKLAKHFNTEIISSDSRQFYKEMKIGTAVPSKSELQLVPHYFIQDRSIFDDYNVGAFEQDAIKLLDQRFQEKDVMIMVGGSGLYVDAVTDGLDDFPKVDSAIREQLKLDLKESGIEPLQKKLEEIDPVSYKRIDVHNKQRLIRALEISIGAEHPFSHYHTDHKKKRNFSNIKIGLQADREIIYARINQRVDQMVASGLVEEARSLYAYKNLNALQTVGYKELFTYFDGDLTLTEAISEIKKNTRRFAKRQGTWFRKDAKIKWFDYETDPEKIISYIETSIKLKESQGQTE